MINERIIDLAGLNEEKTGKENGVELIKEKGLLKVRLRLNKQYSKTYTFPLHKIRSGDDIAIIILKALLANADYFPALKSKQEQPTGFFGSAEKMTDKYAGVIEGIKKAISDDSRMLPGQWEEFFLPIDLTFKELFRDAI